MSIFNYNNSIIIYRRKGDETDPFPYIEQISRIVNNQIILKEIPSEFQGVEITNNDTSEIYYEIKKLTDGLISDKFYCDYTMGIISFNSSENLKTCLIKFYGIGVTAWPADRCYSTLDENNNITQTLQDIVDEGIIAIEAMEQVGDLPTVINQGNLLKEDLETDIITATTKKSDLDISIEAGNTMIVNLQNVNTYQIKTATEDLLAGDFVNIYNNSGTVSVRKANATDSTKPAHGFILENVSSGGDIAVYFEGINDKFTGLTVGTKYYLNTVAGQITSTIPSNSNNILQYLGDAINSTSIYFTKRDYVLLV